MNLSPLLTLIMLEDDHDRLARFTSVLQNVPQPINFQYRRTASDFIEAYKSLVFPPKFIALDHDLFTDDPSEPDPGDGRQVAAFLAKQIPCSPVLIHSTNVFAAESMLSTLRDAGWNVDRIAPLGEDWIESYWFPYVTKMLVASLATFQWLSPWSSVDSMATESRITFKRELQAELSEQHSLYGIDVELIAQGNGDDALFKLLDGSGRYAVVHLTWARHPEPIPWPDTEIYNSFDDFVSQRMLPEHCE